MNNGMCSLYNVDGKSTAIMNIFTGGLSLFINFVNLVQGNYYAEMCIRDRYIAGKMIQMKKKDHREL